MKFLDFFFLLSFLPPDADPDEAQQGPNPRQFSCVDARLQERGVTRAHHSLVISSTAALPLAFASAGSCYVITGSFIVMRMVSLEFYDWRWRVWRRVRGRVGEGRGGKEKKWTVIRMRRSAQESFM